MQIMGTSAGGSFARLTDARPLGAEGLAQLSDAAGTIAMATKILVSHPDFGFKEPDTERLKKISALTEPIWHLPHNPLVMGRPSSETERTVRASFLEMKTICRDCHTEAHKQGRMHDYNEVAPP